MRRTGRGEAAGAAYDVVVVGLGVAGSAAARELARRGLTVLGLDRFGPDHRRGSSHGESRLFRLLYHEAPYYVPLLRRAREDWRELERECGEDLFVETGGLVIGPPDGRLVPGCLATAAERDVTFEEPSPGDAHPRFPAFEVPDGDRLLLDPGGGVLLADRCLSALRSGARRAGADLRFGERVLDWSVDGDGLAVETRRGTVPGGALLVAAGGWTADLVGGSRLPLVVERQTVHRFPAGDDRHGRDFGPERFPVFLLERNENGSIAYGAPDVGRGVKVALHHGGEQADRPGDVRRSVDPGEARAARGAVEELLPRLGRSAIGSDVCLYTDTPDRDFVIDRLSPEMPPVVLACGFSGHGFKFAPVVAEAAADLLVGETPAFDLDPFRTGRWQR